MAGRPETKVWLWDKISPGAENILPVLELLVKLWAPTSSSSAWLTKIRFWRAKWQEQEPLKAILIDDLIKLDKYLKLLYWNGLANLLDILLLKLYNGQFSKKTKTLDWSKKYSA